MRGASKGLELRFRVVADDRAGNLLVFTPRENMPLIEKVVKTLDVEIKSQP